MIDGRRMDTDVSQFLRIVQEFDLLDMDLQKGVAWVTQHQMQTGE